MIEAILSYLMVALIASYVAFVVMRYRNEERDDGK